MADQSDVENALVSLVTVALYPNGTEFPSVPGPDCKIYRGWPNSNALNTDLSAGLVNVTVFPSGEPGRNTTRFIYHWEVLRQSSSLSVSVLQNSITFSGTAAQGQLAGILVDNVAYVYRVEAIDTPETVAANLAKMLRATNIANLSGPTITIPGATHIVARTNSDAAVSREIRRQQQSFRITFWCPGPAARDCCVAAVDQVLSGRAFITMDDGSQGFLRYDGTLVFDQSQDALLYRRDLIYQVEYPTIEAESLPAMLFGCLALNAATVIT
jgi:hypothetical protein